MYVLSGRKRRLLSISWALLIILSGSTSTSLAKPLQSSVADSAARFQGVTKWVGTFSIQANATKSDSASGIDYWTVNRNVSGSLSASSEASNGTYNQWKGTYQGQATINDEEKYAGPHCTYLQKWNWSGAIGSTMRLFINPNDNSYIFYLDNQFVDAHTHVDTLSCDTGSTSSPDDYTTQMSWHPSGSNIFTLPIPDKGLVLEGSREIEGQWPGSNGGGWSTWTVSWHLEPANTEKLKLVVHPRDYDTWLPEGGASEDAGTGNVSNTKGFTGLASPAAQAVGVTSEGNTLVVTADLQQAGGGTSTQQAQRFIFDLLDVSTEPGVAMNFPKRAAARRDPDLIFDPALNAPTAVFISDYMGGQRAEWVLPATHAGVIIRSNDWGAWGVLRVTAVMESGEEVVGYLQGDPSQTNIRLPKRAADSWIADAWKEQNGVVGMADDSDAETVPVGDARVKGDGLTLYEEYRGFFENGVHIRTNPTVKDLFINDRVGGRSKDGIALFARITGLNVHHLLQTNEMDLGKIINFNHSDGAPHMEHESALILQQAPAGSPASHVQGEMGGKPIVPANVEELKVLPPSDMGPDGWRTVKIGGKSVKQDEYSATVAHELLHAINVKHHGEGDDEQVHWAWGKDSKGKDVLLENGVPIKIETEQGAQLGWAKKDMPDGIDLWIGVDHGQHSGDASCVMRYDNSIAYRGTGANANVRYWVYGEEPVGNSLCTTKTGTGVNAANRSPQSRYGDALDGDCAHQFIVNDIVIWTGIK